MIFQVYDGTDTQVFSLCSADTDKSFYSRYNKMIVRFAAEHTLTEVGFLITYTIKDGTTERSNKIGFQTAGISAFRRQDNALDIISQLYTAYIKINTNCTQCFITGAKLLILVSY